MTMFSKDPKVLFPQGNKSPLLGDLLAVFNRKIQTEA